MDHHNPQPEIIDTAAPVAITDRIKTIDIIRGVALLGILMMNMPGFGIDNSFHYFLTTGSHETTDFKTHAVIEIFFSGTMRGLFSMLFGAGIILFTLNKKDTPLGISVTELYYRRLVILLIFGLINAYVFLWWGDILYHYALIGMILYPFRKAAAKWLFLLGIVCIGIAIFKNQLWYSETRQQRAEYNEAVKAKKEGKKLTPEQEQAKSMWIKNENWKPDSQNIARNVEKMRGDYSSVFNQMMPRTKGTEVWWMYHGIWDPLSMMFLGMGLFVVGFFSNKWKTSGYIMSLLIGYGIGIPVSWAAFSINPHSLGGFGEFVDRFRMPYWHLYDIKRGFLALGHASLFMLIYRSRLVPWLMKALACVGQMAFTNYLVQSIICTLFFYGYGFGYYNKLAFHELYYVVLAVWIFQMIVSPIWLKFFYFGPFEWLWRSLTYWKRQPMRRK